MKVAIHQPCYMPYLGVFYKMWQSDRFVFLDDAQYSNGYVFDWNRIKTPTGECRIKVPTEKKFGDTLNQIRPKDELGWQNRHLKTIEMCYHKAPYFDDFYPVLKTIILDKYSSLSELNITVMSVIAEKFGIRPDIYYSSRMGITTLKEQRVIDICKQVGATSYISGHGAENYQQGTHFIKEGIKLTYTDYKPVQYQQQWNGFIPNLSAIDYIFNEGYDFEKVVWLAKRGGMSE